MTTKSSTNRQDVYSKEVPTNPLHEGIHGLQYRPGGRLAGSLSVEAADPLPSSLRILQADAFTAGTGDTVRHGGNRPTTHGNAGPVLEQVLVDGPQSALSRLFGQCRQTGIGSTGVTALALRVGALQGGRGRARHTPLPDGAGIIAQGPDVRGTVQPGVPELALFDVPGLVVGLRFMLGQKAGDFLFAGRFAFPITRLILRRREMTTAVPPNANKAAAGSTDSNARFINDDRLEIAAYRITVSADRSRRHW